MVMSLTPIRVRGKRSSVQTESSRLYVNPIPSPYPKDQRTFTDPPARSPRHSHTRSENVGWRARLASPLERLPTELLETIFLHNLNLSLPQASPIIGSKLASNHVKTQLVLQICSAESLNSHPCEHPALFPAVRDHAEAQSALLRMKWMTWTFIRPIIIDSIVKFLVRELCDRGLQWLGKGPLVTEEAGSTIRQYIEENEVRSEKRSQGDLPVLGCVGWLSEKPSKLIRISFSLREGMVTISEHPVHGLQSGGLYVTSSPCNRHQWRLFCGAHGCTIPGKLLHEPWTSEKCDFLEMLVKGNATVDWVGTTGGEIADAGLMQALRAGNARATRLLVAKARTCNPGVPWCIHYLSDGSGVQTQDSGLWPEAEVFQTSYFDAKGVGVVPQTRHLRTAVVEAGCQQDVVEALITAEERNIDFEDRAILDWAVEKMVQDDERGPWLLSMLSLHGTDRI